MRESDEAVDGRVSANKVEEAISKAVECKRLKLDEEK
jgi:hypothetical protein